MKASTDSSRNGSFGQIAYDVGRGIIEQVYRDDLWIDSVVACSYIDDKLFRRVRETQNGSAIVERKRGRNTVIPRA